MNIPSRIQILSKAKSKQYLKIHVPYNHFGLRGVRTKHINQTPSLWLIIHKILQRENKVLTILSRKSNHSTKVSMTEEPSRFILPAKFQFSIQLMFSVANNTGS